MFLRNLEFLSLAFPNLSNQTVELDTLYRMACIRTICDGSTESKPSPVLPQDRRARSGPFDFEKVGFKGIDCFKASAKAGDSLSKPEAHGDELEICWLHKGRIHITLPREQHWLKAGQALKFDAALPHNYEILEDSEMTIVHIEKTHRF